MKITETMTTKMKELRKSAFQFDFRRKLIKVSEDCDNITLIKAAIELEQELFMKMLAVDIVTDIVCNNSDAITGESLAKIANAIGVEPAEEELDPILIEKYAHIRGFRSGSINNEWVFAYDQAKVELTERLKLGTVTKQQVIDLYDENEDLD